jgi:carbon-monoxide dehydrogenase catalytic subunit
VGAALGFRLLGVPSYHSVPAPIGGSAGSAAVARFFREDTAEMLGAAMVVEPRPHLLAERVLGDLERRRAAALRPAGTADS